MKYFENLITFRRCYWKVFGKKTFLKCREILKDWMYIILLMVYCSLYSAVAACTFNWTMASLIQNKDEMLDWTPPAFKCDQQKKRKACMESTVWKHTVESVVHSIWKEYGNYNMSLLMPELTGLRENTTHLDWYVLTLLRFDILKNSIPIVSFLLVL